MCVAYKGEAMQCGGMAICACQYSFVDAKGEMCIGEDCAREAEWSIARYIEEKNICVLVVIDIVWVFLVS